MAQTEHLPIYKASYDLCPHLEQVVAKFARSHRYGRCHWRPGPVRGTMAIALAGERAVRALENLRASVASYSGHLRHGSAWRAWDGAWACHPWLGALFVRDGWTFEPRWPVRTIRAARRFREQYWGLVGRAGARALVFCPVGRFLEFYGPQRLVAERVLGLRRVYLPRAGYGFAVGFPRRLCCAYTRGELCRPGSPCCSWGWNLPRWRAARAGGGQSGFSWLRRRGSRGSRPAPRPARRRDRA